MLSDMYQINMAYAYWKSGRHGDSAVFDLFFRKNPFHGEFTIFAGLEECLKFLENFKYSESDIQYLKETMPETVEPEFFEFLSNVTTKDVKMHAIDEGKVVFPSLVATNAARYRMAAGRKIKLLEFGLRRAQGPDGGLTASKYSYVGGFDGTSNVLAGKLYNIPVKGTHAHSYVSSYSSLDELHIESEASDGELAAFISFAIAFPSGFVALIDTYDVLKSGILNFSAVALGLHDLGYRALGVRIDSGDLAYLSCVARSIFATIAKGFDVEWFEHLSIVASNDINEETIISLNEQGHKIDCFGIGTHLGCVFKLVEINGEAKIKLSQDVEKVTCPGKKSAYRLYGADGHALIDLMHRTSESAPKCGSRVLCRHPFQESKRAYVSPAKVESLFKLYWKDGKIQQDLPNLEEIRDRVTESLQTLRQDHKRNLNPTPYKVGVTDDLYNFLHDLWLQNAPIGELF
ncbi:Nicotinate phosphoribosyltransferase-like [Homarus americanus]|uniref:Nicotinate phosphoribosyltransferase n=1 Tax=Homarus americanus TaxID=6706 RepID=A0A8J5KPE8_HOMAM|nr:Nicotinate phosphoribosyltransferase-like [Homarus americanus]